MHPFHHLTPATLPEALAILAQHNGEAKVIAGGSDLVLQMRNGLIAPQTIVNIKRLPELKGLHYDPQSGLRIAALTTLRELHRSPLVRQHYPALSHAAGRMASEQIRAFATVGGNLCNGSPSADTAPPLIAMQAAIRLVSQHGEREMPLESFFLGPGQTALRPGELLKEIRLPPPTGHTIFIKHIPRAFMDISIVCTAIRLLIEDGRCTDARIVLGAVAPTPMRPRQAENALLERGLTPAAIAQAADLAARESRPIDDEKSSAWYRKRMVKVVVQRGLESLLETVSA